MTAALGKVVTRDFTRLKKVVHRDFTRLKKVVTRVVTRILLKKVVARVVFYFYFIFFIKGHATHLLDKKIRRSEQSPDRIS